MAKFHIGQRARIVGKHPILSINITGLECIVVADHGPLGRKGLLTGEWYRYEVKVINSPRGHNHNVLCHASELEPILDQPETTTWEEVQKISSWNPTQIKEPQQ
jgi:hypothetical protein